MSEVDLDEEKKLQIIKELMAKFNEYQKTIAFMTADAPIEILCLPAPIEKILLSNGLLRVYDLFDCDFAKIKGFGVSRIRDLTARLDQFFSML
jgi:hypothetical protein